MTRINETQKRIVEKVDNREATGNHNQNIKTFQKSLWRISSLANGYDICEDKINFSPQLHQFHLQRYGSSSFNARQVGSTIH